MPWKPQNDKQEGSKKPRININNEEENDEHEHEHGVQYVWRGYINVSKTSKPLTQLGWCDECRKVVKIV